MRKRRMVAISGVALALGCSGTVLPSAEAAPRWPKYAQVAGAWIDQTESIARVTIRSEQTAYVGRGWFKLKSRGGFTFNCSSVEGIEFGRLNPKNNYLIPTASKRVAELYCDGSVITGKIEGTTKGIAYGMSAETNPVTVLGNYDVIGSVDVNGKTTSPTSTFVKSTDTAKPSRPAMPNLPSQRVWAAEFNRSKTQDLAGWYVANNSTYGVGGGSTNIMRSDNRNVRVENGSLVIQSRRERPSGATKYQPFSSGYATSPYLLDLSVPGRLDARINPGLTPGRSKGKWPGVWLRNRGSQEFDITEMVGTSQSTRSRSTHWQATAHVDTAHMDRRKRAFAADYAGSSNAFHVWSTIWDGRGNIKVYCDGLLSANFQVSLNSWMRLFRGEFQIRVDQFVQGSGPGPVDGNTEFRTGFQVDYFRYYV